MITYTKSDIEELKQHDGKYCMPDALFDTMQYKLIRLEVKWAYVACLNILIQEALFDEQEQAYMNVDNPGVVDILRDLAHKAVDQDKVNGYISEMEDYGLLESVGQHIYLKKIVNVF